MKKCSTCEETKELDKFHKHKPSKDGLKPRCKLCRKNKVKLIKKCKSCEKTFVCVRATKIYCSSGCICKARYFDKKEEVLKTNREYYKNNKRSVLKTNREYYKNNKKHKIDYQKEYYQNNKSLYFAYAAKRRAKKLNATIGNFDQEIKKIYKNCPKGYHVDHIIPLQGVGINGLHVPWNLQYLTSEENLKKSSKFDGTLANETWREDR